MERFWGRGWVWYDNIPEICFGASEVKLGCLRIGGFVIGTKKNVTECIAVTAYRLAYENSSTILVRPSVLSIQNSIVPLLYQPWCTASLMLSAVLTVFGKFKQACLWQNRISHWVKNVSNFWQSTVIRYNSHTSYDGIHTCIQKKKKAMSLFVLYHTWNVILWCHEITYTLPKGRLPCPLFEFLLRRLKPFPS